MFKKVLISLVILVILVALVGLCAAVMNAVRINSQETKTKERLNTKIQREVGTPTVQQLLDKVESNYKKIQDLKAIWNIQIRHAEYAELLKQSGGFLGTIVGDLITGSVTFFFKAPDKLKWIPQDKVLTEIIKDNTEYSRNAGAMCGEEITENTPVGSYTLKWDSLTDTERLFEFYFKLDEIITKFDTKVIDNPQTNIWVIEAVPKKGNPEDEYNYPHPKSKLEIFVDYEKGVITKIDDFSDYTNFHPAVPSGVRLVYRLESQNFTLIRNTWIPTRFITTKFSIPKFRPEEIKVEDTLSNIEINTGITDNEFEF